MAERIRIQKAIANAGLMSRRAAENAMVAGRVRLNDQDVVLGDRVDLDSDTLTLDGIPIPVKPGLETHLLYKPVGVISTADDPQGRPTVLDLVDTEARIYPVGRLDADSEGLLLLTNDGDLTHRVTHPSFGVTKTYMVLTEGVVKPQVLRRLETGVDLSDGPASAEKVSLKQTQGDRSLIEMTMIEGRNREVRRMMDAVGHTVVSLVRTAIGGLTDRSLQPGESRLLEALEVREIFGR